jgi:pyrroloquinoline quinone biosynthesis protein B
VRARPRTQSSLAIRGDGGPWWLVNASPDLRQQLETLERPVGVRSSPIAGVLLTDAEIDHTAGLLLLRESGSPIRVYGDPEIERVLKPTLLRMLERFCGVDWHPPGPIEGLEVEPFRDGLTFRDGASVFTYAPALARLDDDVLARLEASDLVFVDGTFWFDDDLARLGISQRTAADMGHVPLTDSLPALARLERPRIVLVHINNTNPILLEDSPEREQVVRSGVEVAYDGLEVEL